MFKNLIFIKKAHSDSNGLFLFQTFGSSLMVLSSLETGAIYSG